MRVHRVVALGIVLATGACSASQRASSTPSNRLIPAAIDALTGAPWVGPLTYLDYTSKKSTTIDSTLSVRRTAQTPPTWEFGIGYSKEPHADNTQSVVLSIDAGLLGDERVVSREAIAGGGVKFVTESQGQDDHLPAQFRFEHTITTHEYSRRKMVRFQGQMEFFERHVYRWLR